MTFAQGKEAALNNLYAAQKVGDLDTELMPLLSTINSLGDYYTTSSCAGRIVLMQDLGGKGECRFLGKWHRRVCEDDVFALLTACGGVVWFRYECPILHVVAKNVDAASFFLHLCRESGFKRSGIQSVKKERVLVEVLSTERIEAPLMDEGKKIASDDYIRYLIGKANDKHGVGKNKLERLTARWLHSPRLPNHLLGLLE